MRRWGNHEFGVAGTSASWRVTSYALAVAERAVAVQVGDARSLNPSSSPARWTQGLLKIQAIVESPVFNKWRAAFVDKHCISFSFEVAPNLPRPQQRVLSCI